MAGADEGVAMLSSAGLANGRNPVATRKSWIAATSAITSAPTMKPCIADASRNARRASDNTPSASAPSMMACHSGPTVRSKVSPDNR
jgi:hypothetical protein